MTQPLTAAEELCLEWLGAICRHRGKLIELVLRLEPDEREDVMYLAQRMARLYRLPDPPPMSGVMM